jgi:bifunctional DNase/RNase
MKRNSPQKTKKIILVVLFVVIFLAGFASGILAPREISDNIKKISNELKYSHEGFVQVQPNIEQNVLSFSTTCWVLSFGITEDQAYSIRRGIDNVIDVRPLTHDSLKDIMDVFDIEVIEARIDEYKDSIYYSKLFATKDDKVLDLDIRPSDATAIAVRYDVPIYIKEDILKAYGINVCENIV